MTEKEKVETYLEAVFGTKEPKEEKIEAALNRTHENRKLEIDLYWKRSMFLWKFMVGFFTGYVVLLIFVSGLGHIFSGLFTFRSGLLDWVYDIMEWVLICLPHVGFAMSLVWLRVEIESRSRQENCEKHIDFLEYALSSSLHKTMIGEPINFYSSGKIYNIIIRLIIVVWVVIIVAEILPNFAEDIPSSLLSISPIFIITLVYFWLISRWSSNPETMLGKGKNQLILHHRRLPDIKISSSES